MNWSIGLAVFGIVVFTVLCVLALWRKPKFMPSGLSQFDMNEDLCAYQPLDSVYGPCTRESGHGGPCAHPLARVPYYGALPYPPALEESRAPSLKTTPVSTQIPDRATRIAEATI